MAILERSYCPVLVASHVSSGKMPFKGVSGVVESGLCVLIYLFFFVIISGNQHRFLRKNNFQSDDLTVI